ncbi:unnamed protein product [Alopecurus aequalis]
MCSVRRRPRSPSSAAPLDDDDLLSEILLRLPPQPSSLPRASAVCRRWRSVASVPGFSRRFRRHHRRNPPLLGFFDIHNDLSFVPALEAPNRVPHGRFSLPPGLGDCFRSFGCRHGLALISLRKLLQVLVWDPATGDQHRIALPPGFNMDKATISGAVLRAAGDGDHFQVALVGNGDKQDSLAVASVYSSETRVWSNLISAPLPPDYSVIGYPTMIYTAMPAVLVGDCLYWRLTGSSSSILEFDLGSHSLAVIPVPVDLHADKIGNFRVVRADGGGLGFLFLSEFSAQLWKRNTGSDGVASWVLGRTIEMDKLLSLVPEERGTLMIVGYAEDNNMALLWTVGGLFTISLESSHFTKRLETKRLSHYHAFESVYTAESGIGGGHHGAALLHNT